MSYKLKQWSTKRSSCLISMVFFFWTADTVVQKMSLQEPAETSSLFSVSGVRGRMKEKIHGVLKTAKVNASLASKIRTKTISKLQCLKVYFLKKSEISKRTDKDLSLKFWRTRPYHTRNDDRISCGVQDKALDRFILYFVRIKSHCLSVGEWTFVGSSSAL